MKMTGRDIQTKQFPSRIKGYDRDDLYSFLEIVSEEMEILVRENAKLREDTCLFEKQLAEYENLDKTLKDMLSGVIKNMEECRSKSKNEAQLIVREATAIAQKSIKEAQDELAEILDEVNMLKDIRNHFKNEMKNIITSHLARL